MNKERQFFIKLRDSVLKESLSHNFMSSVFCDCANQFESTDNEISIINSPLEKAFYISFYTMKAMGAFEQMPEIELIRQYAVGNYKIDFAIKYEGKLLGIEFDGFSYHDRNVNEFSKSRERQNAILKSGITLYVYTYSVMKNNYCKILDDIEEWLIQVTEM